MGVLWEYYLRSTFVKEHDHSQPDENLIQLVQEAMGYSLTTDTNYQVGFWCYGTAANGKTVLLHTLEELAGEKFLPHRLQDIVQGNYEKEDLENKTVMFAGYDYPKEQSEAGKLIRAMLCKEPIHVLHLWKSFTIQPPIKMWWHANRSLNEATFSKDICEKLIVIPFHNCFTGNREIERLRYLLEQEKESILSWAESGYHRLHFQGHFSV